MALVNRQSGLRWGWTLGCVSALVVVCAPRDAKACAPPMCVAGWLLPPDGTDPGAAVPANFGALLWYPRVPWSQPDVTDSSVSLTDITAAPPKSIPLTITPLSDNAFLLTPDVKLQPDTDYRVLEGDFCQGTGLADDTAVVREFRTSADALAPTELGTLSVAAPFLGELSVSTTSGSCGDKITAVQVAITLELSPSALPWKDAFYYQTYVDGDPWGAQHSIKDMRPPGTSWAGRAQDLLFHRCAAIDPLTDSGLDEGLHVVSFAGELPGLGLSFRTPDVTVELSCAQPDAGLPDADAPDADAPDVQGGDAADDAPTDLDSAVAEDASTMDASLPEDAAADSAAGPDGGAPPAADPGEDSSGCGCSTPVTPRGAGGIALALSALLLVRRRRTR